MGSWIWLQRYVCFEVSLTDECHKFLDSSQLAEHILSAWNWAIVMQALEMIQQFYVDRYVN